MMKFPHYILTIAVFLLCTGPVHSRDVEYLFEGTWDGNRSPISRGDPFVISLRIKDYGREGLDVNPWVTAYTVGLQNGFELPAQALSYTFPDFRGRTSLGIQDGVSSGVNAPNDDRISFHLDLCKDNLCKNGLVDLESSQITGITAVLRNSSGGSLFGKKVSSPIGLSVTDFPDEQHVYARVTNGLLTGKISSFKASFVTAERAPPQYVHLAFGDQSPFVAKTISMFGKESTYLIPGAMPAKTWTTDEQNQIQRKLTEIFSSAGVDNIIFSKQEVPNSTSIYFVDALGGSLLGKASDIDQFNDDKTNEAVIFAKNNFFSGNEAIDRIARAAAHELGHTLGLRHVLPGEPEILDYYDNPADTFQNLVSNIREKPIDSGTNLYMTHNPVYHLRRYINGETDEELRGAGVLPGSWDLTFFEKAKAKLDFGEGDYQLYQVAVLSGASSDDGVQTVAYFEKISLLELAQMDFLLPADGELTFLASMTLDGPIDITLGKESSGNLENVVSLADANFENLGLYRIDPGSSNFSLLTEVNLVVVTVPEPSSAVLALIGAVLIWSRRRRFLGQ